MPIQLQWFNDEKTILLETFEGDWTAADYRTMVDQAAELLAEVSHTVHIIAEATRNSPRLPANMLGGGMAYAIRHVPANQGITVFVHADTVIQMLIGIARKLSPKLARTMFLSDSLEEAQQIIMQQISKTG